MPQCPDCEAVKAFSDSLEGNGMCSACRGTEFAGFFDAIALELLNVEQPPCEECNGSASARPAAEPA